MRRRSRGLLVGFRKVLLELDHVHGWLKIDASNYECVSDVRNDATETVEYKEKMPLLLSG